MRRTLSILALIMLLFFMSGATIWVLQQLGIVQGPWTDKLFTIFTGLGAGTVVLLSVFGILQFFLSLIPTETPSSPIPAPISSLTPSHDLQLSLTSLSQPAPTLGTTHHDTLKQNAPIWNIPYRRNPFFTGRESLLKRLRENLTTKKATALTQAQAVHGLGGTGKTHGSGVSLNQAAFYLYEHALYGQAEPLLKRALTIREQVFGPDHPNTVKVRENYDGLLRKMKREEG